MSISLMITLYFHREGQLFQLFDSLINIQGIGSNYLYRKIFSESRKQVRIQKDLRDYCFQCFHQRIQSKRKELVSPE